MNAADSAVGVVAGVALATLGKVALAAIRSKRSNGNGKTDADIRAMLFGVNGSGGMIKEIEMLRKKNHRLSNLVMVLYAKLNIELPDE